MKSSPRLSPIEHAIKINAATLSARKTRSEITLEFMKWLQSRRCESRCSRVSLEKGRNRRRNCFYRVNIAKRALPCELGDGGEIFRLRNRCARDTALSRRRRKKNKFFSCALFFTLKNGIYFRTLSRGTRARDRFRMNRVSRGALSLYIFARRRAYVSADADGNGSHGQIGGRNFIVSAKCIEQDGIFCRGFENLHSLLTRFDFLRRAKLLQHLKTLRNSFQEMPSTEVAICRHVFGTKCANVTKIIKVDYICVGRIDNKCSTLFDISAKKKMYIKCQ